MTGKSLCMAAAFAAALGAFAFPAHARTPDDSLSGIYVGGFGGFAWTDADLSGGPTFNVDGGDFGVFAGYQFQHLFSQMGEGGAGISTAVEGHFAWSNADDTQTVGAASVKIEKRNEWGVSARPGLTFISDTMPLGLTPYAILGFRRAEFRTSGSGNSDHNGFDLGIGSELMAYRNFGLRLDYSHVFYKEESGIDPDENDLRLGVALHL
jgi:opacity protein-like surface antigen